MTPAVWTITSSASTGALQDDLDDETAPDVGQHEGDEARKRPAQGDTASPAPQVAPDQEGAEQQPGNKREERLVLEAESLAEEGLGEHHAADQGQRQQDEGNADEAEQQ